MFSTGYYMPHGMCLLWQPDLLRLHIISDATIAASYLAIPAALIYLMRKRPDYLPRTVGLLFCIFIISCAVTHLMAILVLWRPFYILEGWTKAVTAFASLTTSIVLWNALPKMLTLPSLAQFEASKSALAAEIANGHVNWVQANFDSLTRMANRRLLLDRLNQEILKAERSGKKLALMFIDLDRFKDVNDSLGHEQGDKLLIEAAARIRTCLRASDTVARLGGDEFVALLPELRTESDASDVGAKLLQALREPFSLDGVQAVVSASIGIAIYPQDARDADALLKNGDLAMYLSKGHGRDRCSFFTPELEIKAQRRAMIVRDLRAALALGQLQVYFQPIIDLKTGVICKAEALVRWRHPELGQISPLEFVPLAEESGQIIAIGNWVACESLKWTARWRKTLKVDFQISINKSPEQFKGEQGKIDGTQAALQAFNVPGKSVVIEITEGLLMNATDEVKSALKSLRESGVGIAIDDFGTGYSSLSYLKHFELDYVKIDRVFTSQLAESASDLALTQAIIAMSHALGLETIGEGVETEAQRKLLCEAGCDYGQGYLFSRPVPPEEFEQLLSQTTTAV